MPKMLDDIHMIVSGEIAPPPIATLLGFTLTSVEPGEAVIEFEAASASCQPDGHAAWRCPL